MQNIFLRKASPNDLDTLLEFEQGIVSFERPFDETLKEGRIHYYDLEKMITAENVHLVVAEIEGEIIGSGYARIQNAKNYLKHEQYAYLGFMYVKPEHRGKGVNQMIMDEFKSWCLVNNISEMRLEVYNDNLSAIKAYEKAGFTKNLVEMRFGLSG